MCCKPDLKKKLVALICLEYSFRKKPDLFPKLNRNNNLPLAAV